MTILSYVLYGLTAWTAVSVFAGLGFGAFLKYADQAEGFAPAMVEPQALRKVA